VSCRTATIKRIAGTILGALVGARPGRMPAANSGTLLVMAFGGRDPETGRPFVASELAAGGMGARPDKDGIDVIETDVSNCMNIPVESVEMNFPLRIPPRAPVDGLRRCRTLPRRARPGEDLRGDDHGRDRLSS
jgi:N-methylhydantoinase B/oxoprolinase/acetone carboxylase alpha subunit